MKRLPVSLGLLIGIVAGMSLPALGSGPPSSDEIAFFETRIRPVLVKHCYPCHSAEAPEIGGKLRLDSPDGWQVGGENGPAIVSGKPDESLLIMALRYDGLEMPPEHPLPEPVIQDFVSWVNRGAPVPQPKPVAAVAVGSQNSPAASDEDLFWSLRPVLDSPIPEVKRPDWPRGAIDHFILSRIEQAGIQPTHDAKPAVLVRRLKQDLLGLPPTFEEIQSFEEDCRRSGGVALERLVDHLLESPQFGEHWGRFWLDVARYGESNGNDGLGRNPTFPHAWRYRDYVIEAFNSDLPFDQFISEQVAGDLLPSTSPEERDRRLIATGFLALGSKPAKAMNPNFEMDVVADQIDVIGRGILGLSIGCARCHDHKFDPIPTRDYYALAGIFTSTETLWGTAAHEGLTAPSTDLLELQTAEKYFPPTGFVETVYVRDSNTGEPKPVPKSKWPVGTPLAMGVRDQKKPADTKLCLKGESDKPGDSVPRGFLSACRFSDEVPVDPQQSGRLQLAGWLTRPDQPLTPRVIVNRVWQQLFGEGIVRTPDDFGTYGDRPSHPELLDHLASRFVHDGWSMKRLVRTIALSRTYQLAVDGDPRLMEADPRNILLARHSRRRLNAEALRDGMLQAAGQLDPNPRRGSLVGHRDILVNLAGNLHEPSRHRSVYLPYLRSSPPPELAPFDLPDFTGVVGRRDTNTLSSQALHLFNSQFVIEQSRSFAQSVIDDCRTPEDRIRLVWRRALGRDPDSQELAQAGEFVQTPRMDLSELQVWSGLCQAVLISNEFRYID